MKISVLVAARKNSKYLAKFLFGLIENSECPRDLDVLVMMNADDLWNRELVHFFERYKNFRFFMEDKRLGRAGLHVYLNDLYKHAKGDWIVYFCEDHFVNPPAKIGWDVMLESIIAQRELDPKEPWIIVPKFDNVGSMNHVLSRGFVEAQGGYLAQHGNLDSYINHVAAQLPKGRIVLVDDEWFHDFTHDKPGPMDESHHHGPISDYARSLPKYDSGQVRSLIEQDAARVTEAIKEAE